jgi:hypothetical protein
VVAAAALPAVDLLAGAAEAAPTAPGTVTVADVVRAGPVAVTAPTRTQVLHLLRRATYGQTPSEILRVTKMGTRAWLEQQLKPSTCPDPTGTLIGRLYPEAGWSIAQVYQQVDAGHIQRFGWDVMIPLSEYSIAMATWSSRQLYEVMVDFWSNHLNVANPSDSVWDSRQSYDRNVIRWYAMGKFSQMLAASAAHPAMLNYLNQADSTKDAPNENYGRELLELHTVGIGAHYTEAEVLDSARIMTGYTLQWDDTKPRYGEYVYDPSIHWTGRVKVLGFTHPNTSSDGRAVANAYINYLAHHPATAHRIAYKLAVRFVADGPSPALVNRMAATYLKYDTAIAPMLRLLFTSNEFYAARGSKVRRPYEDMVATLRTLGYGLLPTTSSAAARRSGPESLYWMSDQLQHAPLAWPQPDGYPDVANAWTAAGGLLSRWNMHLGLAAGWWPDKSQIRVPNLASLLPPIRTTTTYLALINAMATRITGGPLPASHTAAVLTFVGKRPTDRVHAGDQWITWDLARLVALLLDTPNHQLR